MRNIAKCRICKSIIESIHPSDYIVCGCGEIAIDGGPDNFKVFAKSFENILRIDDEGNEIIPIVQSKLEAIHKENPMEKKKEAHQKHSTESLLKLLDNMIERIEEMPPIAMGTPITHYDFLSLLLLFSSLFRSSCKEEI